MSFEMVFLILVNAAVFCALAAFVCVFVAAATEAKPERTISEIKAGHKPPPWTLTDERADAAAFMADPTLFWLDPNRYGEDPDWQTRLFPTPPPVREKAQIENMKAAAAYRAGSVFDYMLTEDEWEAKYRISPDASEDHPHAPKPACPTCGGFDSEATATHGDDPSMWRCRPCLTEFTRAGETKTSKRERKLRESTDIADRYRAKRTKLPCGCISTLRFKQDHEGYRFSVCNTCGGDWYCRSNDLTGRTLAQGEKVMWDNEAVPPSPPAATADFEKGIRREAEWKRVIASGGNDGAGSCPDHYGCGWPVKRTAQGYLCTNKDCRHSKTAWR